MGVAGILPRLAPVMQSINISNLTNDRYGSTNDSPIFESNIGRKRKFAANKECALNPSKIRVGIDISNWIAKACHGRGAILLDDRHLTNYGRAEIFRERYDDLTKSTKNFEKNNDVRKESIEIEQDDTKIINRWRELQSEFISDIAPSVVRKIISLKTNLNADILVVFDGASPPIKYKCCRSRRANRDSAVSKIDELNDVQADCREEIVFENGSQIVDVEKSAINLNNKIRAAKKAGSQNSEVHCGVISAVMKLLREEKIPFLVAPYEADGQIAYLSNNGLLDLIVSEDSDFIGHGVENVLYKYKDVMNEKEYKGTGLGLTGELLRKSDFGATSSSFSLAKFSDVMLSVLLVASGCDYCKSLRGIGVVSARNIVERAFGIHQNDQQKPILEKVIHFLFENSTAHLSKEEKADYERIFLAALAMFRHPVVFDPLLGKCLFEGSPDPALMEYKPYSQIVTDKSKLSEIVGQPYNLKLGIYVAEGWINPRTWSLWNNESETPENVLKFFRRESLTLQPAMKSIYKRDNTASEIEINKLPFEDENKAKESVHIFDVGDCNEQTEICEKTISSSSKHRRESMPAWHKDTKCLDNKQEVQRNRSPIFTNRIEDKGIDVINLCDGSEDADGDKCKTQEVNMPLSSNRSGTFITTLQSQSSNCTSSASKPSTQASNQSSNMSADVLSPNLLPSSLTFHVR